MTLLSFRKCSLVGAFAYDAQLNSKTYTKLVHYIERFSWNQDQITILTDADNVVTKDTIVNL